MAEGQGLNPYFEGRFDGESDELCALRLTLARERDEARAEVERLRKATEELYNGTMRQAIRLAATEADRRFFGVGELERTGYIPAGSADEREAKP